MNRIVRQELIKIINVHGLDNDMNTPDWMLADFIMDQLALYKGVVERRDKWFGQSH